MANYLNQYASAMPAGVRNSALGHEQENKQSSEIFSEVESLDKALQELLAGLRDLSARLAPVSISPADDIPVEDRIRTVVASPMATQLRTINVRVGQSLAAIGDMLSRLRL